MAKYNIDTNNHHNNKLSNSNRLDILELQQRIDGKRAILGIKVIPSNFHLKCIEYERKRKDVLYTQYQYGIIL